MYIKFFAFAVLLFLFSCNGTDKNKPGDTKTETTTEGTNSSGDTEAQKKALNERSRACIALMNSLEEEKNAAVAAGNSEAVSAIQVRIDSAATENAKIGQQLMALEK